MQKKGVVSAMVHIQVHTKFQALKENCLHLHIADICILKLYTHCWSLYHIECKLLQRVIPKGEYLALRAYSTFFFLGSFSVFAGIPIFSFRKATLHILG